MPRRTEPRGPFVDQLSYRSRAITGVPTSLTAFVGRAIQGPVEEPVAIAGWTDYVQAFGGLALESTMSYAVRDYFENGGGEALVVRLDDDAMTGVAPGAGITGVDLRAAGRGLYALDRADLFNLLCLPPPAPSGDLDPSVAADVVAYCRERRAILVMDPPSSWSAGPATAVAEATSGLPLRSPNAAIYYPRLLRPDPLRGGGLESVAPCGAAAGVIARTDRRRGVWKAPAGTEAALRGVAAMELSLGDADSDALNPLGVNCLRELPGRGRVVWGARTREGDDRLASEWKYLPVRRLALFLEESLERGTRWAVFEPNDANLWAGLRSSIETFLFDLFRQGAFQGATPKEAFFVKCDEETTTAGDIARRRVNVLVGFAPLKPAEFVVLRIGQPTG